jgi:hypothetical protein
MTVKKYRYAFGFVSVVYVLFCIVTPQETLNANVICIMPPFFIVISFLAWKSGLLDM